MVQSKASRSLRHSRQVGDLGEFLVGWTLVSPVEPCQTLHLYTHLGVGLEVGESLGGEPDTVGVLGGQVRGPRRGVSRSLWRRASAATWPGWRRSAASCWRRGRRFPVKSAPVRLARRRQASCRSARGRHGRVPPDPARHRHRTQRRGPTPRSRPQEGRWFLSRSSRPGETITEMTRASLGSSGV